MQYDVIICGAGPAGLSAAITLANAGASVAVIEKYSLPREKTCAGILTAKAIAFLEENIPTLDIRQFLSSNKIVLFYKNEISACLQVNNPLIWVDRKKFDSELLNICKALSVEIIQNQKIKSLYPEKNMLCLDNSQVMFYNYLIAADGVHSKIRTLLQIPAVSSAFCLQYYFSPTTRTDYMKNIQLYFGHVPLGYSWVVPNHEFTIVGTGSFMKDYNAINLQKKHDALCTHLFSDAALKRRGAYVPIGGLNREIAYPYENIVFVGDAAGLANPLTGEGIYHALLSGTLASKAYVNTQKKSKTKYYELMRRTISNLHEQYDLLYTLYNDSILHNVFSQLHEYPEYLSTIYDEVVSLEKKSYAELYQELKALFR